MKDSSKVRIPNVQMLLWGNTFCRQYVDLSLFLTSPYTLSVYPVLVPYYQISQVYLLENWSNRNLTLLKCHLFTMDQCNFIICVIWLEGIEQVTCIIYLFIRFCDRLASVLRFCKGSEMVPWWVLNGFARVNEVLQWFHDWSIKFHKWSLMVIKVLQGVHGGY